MRARTRTRRTEEVKQAPPEAVAEIQRLAKIQNDAMAATANAIELVGKGMGLTVEKGASQWSYDVSSGKFKRQR